eukprot:TRINITY_DN895_c0_g2_i1.p1 TRINITY_DN895_c0_g2~~TRINITY_DN895_c0_g2_i1.p1  ORF type:complete len:1412 (+),score=328.98 TRINITY_DN895_c0_g2_i1:616-4236(+)
MAIDERMEDLVNAPVAVEDALVSLFDHSDHTLQRRVVETYVRRLYQPYLVKESVRMQWHRAGLIATWQFLEESISQKSLSSAVSDKTFDKTKKWGSMVILKSLQFLPTAVNAALKEITHALQSTNGPTSDGTVCTGGFGNMLHLALVGMNNPMNLLQDSGDEDQAQQRINKLVKALKEESLGSSLRDGGIGMISCIIQRDDGRGPMRHCFNWSFRNQCFEEEPLLRHLQPPLSNLLELDKLKGYKDMQYASSRDRQWHMYAVIDKPAIQRMFLRTLLRQPKYVERDMSMSVTESNIVKSLQGVLEELELCAHNANIKSDHVHVFICILRAQQAVDLSSYTRKLEENCDNEDVIADFLQNVAYQVHDILGVQMHRLAVGEWEIRLKLDLMGAASGAWRIVVSNPTGYTCTAHIYKEIQDENKQDIVYRSCSSSCGPLDGVPVSAQYHPLNVVDRKRLIARRNNTTYCYDFPLVFEKALWHQWASNVQNADCKQITKFNVSELIFSENEGAWGTPLVTVDRDVASNNIGMVTWYMEMSTPEFPNGRTVLVVANDVTHNAGSFGPKEDAFFAAVTDLACKKKLPLIYLAANSGARIGVAEEVRARFQVGWYDEQSPDCGFQYLYLSPEDYATVGSSVLAHEVKLESGEVRWIIDDIIGKEEGLGVENLSGSGAIAGAYSRAYQETFTLTFVTGRTVGIGAYLARLGMRCIQRLDQPIILTGYSALNKLLGREVYSSHMQLGGPKIMATNGVVHLTVSDDLEGVLAILKWLSYIPPYIGGPLPIMKSLDPPERLVEYMPEKLCDPREAIRGQECNGKWLGGLFDKDSFTETLEGWAQTVVTGRAKLGGIPVGIIAVETQTVMQVIPADPGQLDSAERVVPQAGQVWFPDSASKTSQALMDFNKEELPLFILANWRGFSGGQRDLFEGILQAGSAIVENLRTYKQPVFVYIPKTGELRGGAWVVVDSKINPDEVEMYAETSARGGVLEPEGMIEIKFRTKELLECMHRLDKKLISLKNRLHKGRDGNIMDVEGIQEQIKNREKQLLPVYKQIAIRFAELHDTSFRMAAKGVIKKVVNWEESRSFFYNRLNRRLAESTLIKKIVDSTGGSLSHRSAELLLKEWFVSSKTDVTSDDLWKDDAAFLAWKNDPSNYETKLKQLRIQKVFTQLLEVANSVEDLDVLPKALATLVEKVDPSVKSDLVGMLKDIINSL